MVINKAVLSGLVGVSLCMANISGIVTGPGTMPNAGVVVMLEKGGQTATTGTNGRFTLVIGTTENLPGNSNLLPNGLSARISGNLMTLTLAERTAVEVATFDLGGKALSTVRKTLDAGCRFISFPYRGAGIYLYEVKMGNRKFVLKGNSAGGGLAGSGLLSQGSSSNRIAKQANVTAAINDVIVATKSGFLKYRCVQRNNDTTGVTIKMIASAGDITDADGNVYQTVRIGNQVWMAENLRTTKYNDGTVIPLDESAATWNSTQMPKYCFYNNNTNPDSINTYGALYNWYVVSSTNPKKIAPTGWHVPTNADWDILQNYLIANQFNWDYTTTGNKIAKSLASQANWNSSATTGAIGRDLTTNNRSGFSGPPGGLREAVGIFASQGSIGYWWSATVRTTSSSSRSRLNYYADSLIRFSAENYIGYSVRLVKD